MPSLGTHDPLAELKTNKRRINKLRDALEMAPVLVGKGRFDVDENAEKRINSTLDFWDAMVGADTVSWKRADNTFIALTRDELASLRVELLMERAKRSSLLHQRANELKAALPDVTERDLVNAGFVVDSMPPLRPVPAAPVPFESPADF